MKRNNDFAPLIDTYMDIFNQAFEKTESVIDSAYIASKFIEAVVSGSTKVAKESMKDDSKIDLAMKHIWGC